MSVAMSLSKAQSLVEQKRLQWARERGAYDVFHKSFLTHYKIGNSMLKSRRLLIHLEAGRQFSFPFILLTYKCPKYVVIFIFLP